MRSAISLFSGAGGMDVGFTDADYEILFANDIDQAACDSYNLNHKTPIELGDLRDFESKISKFEDVDMIFGGPPCQGFSVAGKMNPSDERSKLIWSFFDQVALVRPKAFVCENVKALAVNSKWQFVRDGLNKRSNQLGYKTAILVLNSSDFGVPQARERMFLIGLRTDNKQVSSLDFGDALINSLTSKKANPILIKDIVKKLGRAGTKSNSRTCKAIITYAKNPILRKSPYAGMLFNGAGRPIDPNGVSSTLAASMGGNKTPIVDEAEIFDGKKSFVETYHQKLIDGKSPRSGKVPSRLRRITVDEALAIQTFPEGYQLSGSQSAMYRQIGNAVPCRLAEVVAKTVNEVMTLGLNEFVESQYKQA